MAAAIAALFSGLRYNTLRVARGVGVPDLRSTYEKASTAKTVYLTFDNGPSGSINNYNRLVHKNLT